jgi:hypothetical protein
MILLTCRKCRKEFKVKPYLETVAKYCSRECADNAKKDEGMPEYCRKAQLKWMEKHTHGLFKESGYSLVSLHTWVKRRLQRPDCCEHCGIIPKPIKSRSTGLHLANKSHKYLRDVNDWLWLCVKCHSKYDREHRRIK